jgi:hypothetical protein
MTYTITEVTAYLDSRANQTLDQRIAEVFPQVERHLLQGVLAGEEPESSIRRFYESRFKPLVAIWVARQDESAIAIKAVLDEKSPEITSASVAATATLIARLLDGPNLPERQLIIGIASVVLMVGLKAKKKIKETKK